MIMRLFKEPMVYFCIIGALVYYFYIPTISEEDLTDSEVKLPSNYVETLRANFVNQYNRQPSEEEFQAIIDQEVSAEILFREAWRLQLYVGDSVVRKRMIQKMQFLLEEGSAAQDIPDAALRAYFKMNRNLFASGQKVDIYHVLFNDKQSAENHLKDLQQHDGTPPEPTTGVVAFPLGNAFTQISEKEIKKYLGTDFYNGIQLAEPDQWQGPIKSRYGYHVVKLSQLSKAKDVAFDDVRENIRKRVIEEQRIASRHEAITEIKQRYQVVIAD